MNLGPPPHMHMCTIYMRTCIHTHEHTHTENTFMKRRIRRKLKKQRSSPGKTNYNGIPWSGFPTNGKSYRLLRLLLAHSCVSSWHVPNPHIKAQGSKIIPFYRNMGLENFHNLSNLEQLFTGGTGTKILACVAWPSVLAGTQSEHVLWP